MRNIFFRLALGVSCLIAAERLCSEEWLLETLYDDWRQAFRITEKLYEEKTENQHLIIFQNATFGKMLVLDGVIQTTEADEFVYHEMMTHVPMLAHGNARNVLVIGGGDGGILREVLRHKTLEKVTLVEIDPSVISSSQIFLPSLSQGAFEDPRLRIVIDDGSQYVKKAEEKFDVIICDSVDPQGPGAVLFTSEFYQDCHKLLNAEGIFVNQNGVPFMQSSSLAMTYQNRKPHFIDVGFYLGVIPTYVGGFMAFGWATDHNDHRNVSKEELEVRLKNVSGELRYYTPAIHLASFALPKFIEDKIDPVVP